MRWKIFPVVISIVLVLILAGGCSSLGGSAAKPSQTILRKSIIGTGWQMYQIRVTLPTGTAYPILLKLNDGEKADGYFYLEKGINVDFSVNADSQIYKSANLSSGTTGQVSSDRFSFVASKAQGSTYTLQLNNPANLNEQVVAFLEIIYSNNGSIYIPLEPAP